MGLLKFPSFYLFNVCKGGSGNNSSKEQNTKAKIPTRGRIGALNANVIWH